MRVGERAAQGLCDVERVSCRLEPSAEHSQPVGGFIDSVCTEEELHARDVRGRVRTGLEEV